MQVAGLGVVARRRRSGQAGAGGPGASNFTFTRGAPSRASEALVPIPIP